MKFVYFTLSDSSYLIMNNLHNMGEFNSDNYYAPTLFPIGTNIKNIIHKIKNAPDIKNIITKELTL
jgi:hypothetical protein